jgi:hypothetical protein
VAGRGVVLPLGDDHGLEVLALGHLGLDLLDEALEVGSVLGMLAGGGSQAGYQRQRTCSGLVHSSLGRSWWDMDSCEGLAAVVCRCSADAVQMQCVTDAGVQAYLECAAQTEDTVVGVLGTEALEGVLDDVVLLGQEVVGAQTELPVAGGVAVPVGQRLDPALQPRALHDHGGERGRRHFGGCDSTGGVPAMGGRSRARWW